MKVINTNKLNRFWKEGVLKKLALKVDVAKIVNNFTTTVEGTVADGRALKILNDLIEGQKNKLDELNGKLSKQSKLLWYGDAVSSGYLGCDTTGYTVFDVYCTDGVMLRGVKGYNTVNKKYFAMLGASGAANNGSQWVPAIWQGLIDIYDNHFYLHDITLYTIQDGKYYNQKQITSIYGVW